MDTITTVVGQFNSDAERQAYLAARLSDGEYVLTLDDVKTTKFAVIELAYQDALGAPLSYMNTQFQADSGSQALIAQVLAALGGQSPAGFGWYDISNTKVLMTYAELQMLAAQIMLRGQPLFDQRQARKAAIRDAQDIQTVEAISW